MGSIVDKLKLGFASIAETADFPIKSKVGVISTAVDEVSSSTSKKVGFKQLVTAAQISNSDRYSNSKRDHPGCSEGWFSPNQKDSAGSYCLVSAIDFRLISTYYEAGLTSFNNFLEAQRGKNTFRTDTLLNVIFVSDTHDPGRGNDTAKKLLQRAKAYTTNEFLSKANAVNKVSGIKYHGIVPVPGKGRCGLESVVDSEYTYMKFIEETDGVVAECGLDNYSNFVTQMVGNSKFKSKIFKLPDGFNRKVTKVTVNGTEVSFKQSNNQGSIMINDIPANVPTIDVEVFF